MQKPQWIVAIGASAGGVEALRALFTHLPADTAAAFLVVLHIPPSAPSHLEQVLGRCTAMPVSTPDEGDMLQPDHVYVASADLHLTVREGRICQNRGPKESRARPSVDVLFRSVALAWGAHTIGVVLSGMLDDGTAGAWSIKEHAGIVMVQDPSGAMYPSMPSSAMAHVAVDFVGSAEELAAEIGRRVATSAQPEPEATAMSSIHRTETLIAEGGNALQLGVMDLGRPSRYTCPDCHGVLVQITEGSIVRYRCHTGHAFSLLALLAEVSESIDQGLWVTIRAIEERVMLLRQMAELAAEQGHRDKAADAARAADDTELRIQGLRDLVVDPTLFGRES